MTEHPKEREKNLNPLSEWILDYDKHSYCDPKINNESRDLLIESFNECSDLRKSFHDSLQNLFNNFSFSASMKNIHRFDSFTSFDNLFHEKRKTFGYTEDFGLFKNNSVSKFGIKKKKMKNLKKGKGKDYNKAITSIRKKMLSRDEFYDNEEDEENEYEYDIYNKKENEKEGVDKNELDIINQMVYGDIGQEEYGGEKRRKILTEKVIESENEDSEEKRNSDKNKNMTKKKVKY